MEVYVTIGGQGTRLKAISPLDKQNLYYKDKKIIDWIFQIVPTAQLLGNKKTKSRKETLLEIENKKDIVIIDCDIIPFGFIPHEFSNNTVYVFESSKLKYGSVIIKDNKIVESDEKNSISRIKCSGIYCIKNVKDLLESMKNDNSLVSGMIGADVILENTFMRFGDVEDYYESIAK